MNDISKKEGYLLCCFGKEIYFRLTLMAIKNIRVYDTERPICIITDNTVFFEELNIENTIIKLFDYNNHLFPKINYENDWNKYGLIPKIFQCYYSPFDVTMYLDVDMFFKSNFNHFFDLFYESNQPILIPGLSDENNKSPSNWHWGFINEIMEVIDINIPQSFTTVVLYNQSILPIIEESMPFILSNLDKWNVKPWYCNGYPDEIIYSILLGLNNYKISEQIHSWLLNNNFCDPVNKNI
jgi:hypothetical protein